MIKILYGIYCFVSDQHSKVAKQASKQEELQLKYAGRNKGETCREVEAYMAFTLLSPLYRIVKVSKTLKGTNSSLKKV
jgi:hypothetical protein